MRCKELALPISLLHARVFSVTVRFIHRLFAVALLPFSWRFHMSPNITDLPHRYLRTSEAARFLGLSGRTLEKHRSYGTGPIYRKLGGRVVYAVTDLQAWADCGTVISTSDPRGKVSPAKRYEALVSPKRNRLSR